MRRAAIAAAGLGAAGVGVLLGHWPTAQVYGPTRRPTLRLITCSGAFDAAGGHYVENTVVYAARG